MKEQNKTKPGKRNIFLSYILSAYTVEFVVLNAYTLGSREARKHLCEKEDYLKARGINNQIVLRVF